MTAIKFASASILVVAATGCVFGQQRVQASDSVYTWLLLERPLRHQILDEARQFDRNFYEVYTDSLSIDGRFVHRLFLGRYETRENAEKVVIAIPLTLRAEARMLRLPRSALGLIPPEPSRGAVVHPPPVDTAVVQPTAAAAETEYQNDVDVFLDCGNCAVSFVRQEITFVNWVRDRLDADVHLLVTTQPSAAGVEYTLYFIGLRTFSTMVDTLQFVSSSTDTADERRTELAQTIRLGLVRYVAHTSQAGRLRITSAASRGRTTPRGDPWKSWSFRIAGNGSYDEEEATRSLYATGSIGVNRVTDNWKIQLQSNASYFEDRYDLDDDVITSSRKSGSVRAQVIKSLSRKWSTGLFTSGSTSSFENTDFSTSISPALEFNVFPYTESTRREFRFAYYLNLRSFNYKKVTVFGKTEEKVLHHELQAILQSQEPWGSAYVSLKASNYLTDFEKSLTDLYRIETYTYLEVRLVRGLSVWIESTVSRIRDQIYLPLASATEEEILLGTIQLPTDFSVTFSAGLSITFGSIYNNVVNARFGT